MQELAEELAETQLEIVASKKQDGQEMDPLRKKIFLYTTVEPKIKQVRLVLALFF